MSDSLLPARRLRDVWHVLMGEVWGWVSGHALLKVARHAYAAKDSVTVYRVQQVIARGVELGWADEDPDGGKIVAHRDHLLVDEIRRRVEASKRA